MPRHLVAGVDFGTCFTKVVLREQNTGKALAVPFAGSRHGLLESQLGVKQDTLVPPCGLNGSPLVRYLKMLAANAAAGHKFNQSTVDLPCELRDRMDSKMLRDLLAFYFANVMAAVEDFIRRSSPWQDFELRSGSTSDYLTFQLAVPTGLLSDNGTTERLFRSAFIAGYDLRYAVDAQMKKPVVISRWSDQVASILKLAEKDVKSRFEWQCLLYPEVAAAVQAIFKSPQARDGLYITMDVGAGTVDFNAFRRFGGRHQDYYAALVKPLGDQRFLGRSGLEPLTEAAVMYQLRKAIHELLRFAQQKQPNHSKLPGTRTWDHVICYAFGGGLKSGAYKVNFETALESNGIHRPTAHNLPAPHDFHCPTGVDFGRLAVAYGVSFFRPNLDNVLLPNQVADFHKLYPAHKAPPMPGNVRWGTYGDSFYPDS